MDRSPSAGTPVAATHPDEPHDIDGLASRLNWLRAAVLGANDGIVSVAAVVVGVAAAGMSSGVLLASGVAALAGGALSMALGEYVSVSSQRDSQTALIAKERAELAADPEAELTELTDEQAAYIGVPKQGPYKPDSYRY